MKRLGILWIALLIGLTGLAVSQCAYPGPGGSFLNRAGHQSALDPMGPVARNQAGIFYVTLGVTVFLFVTVGGALAFSIWKFRLRTGDDPAAIPPQSHGHPLVELGLVLASAGLLVVIAVPTFGGILLKNRVPAADAADAIEVNVTGYQWWWSFEYPEYGFHTANELVFPVGRAVKLNLRAGDVIHSFWLPKLAGKTDLIPGQTNFKWIKADAPGTYWGQCAEFCGDSHAYMLFRAHAVSEEAWRHWLDRQRSATVVGGGDYTPLALARDPDRPDAARITHATRLFVQHCARCHSVDSRIQTSGPNLAHFGGRTTLAAGWMDNEPEQLKRWILEPHRVKPGNYMWSGFPDPANPRAVQMEGLRDAGLSEADAEALAAYLHLLK